MTRQHEQHQVQKGLGSTLAVLLTVCVPLAPARADDVAALHQRVSVLEAELAQRDARIAELEAKLAAYETQQQTLEVRQAQLDRREADLEVMAGAVATGELAERYDANVTVRQDAERGRTVVSAGPVAFIDEGLVGDWFVSAVYSVPADEPGATPETVSLFVQSAFSGGQLERRDALTFTLADDSLTLPVAGYTHARKSAGLAGKNRTKAGDETVRFDLDVPTVRRLAEATSLQLETPKGPIVWDREHRALLRALLARIDAGAPATTE